LAQPEIKRISGLRKISGDELSMPKAAKHGSGRIVEVQLGIPTVS
jgi:hypothetical protein